MTAIPSRLRPLLDATSPAQQLARLLTESGHECFLVGGSVPRRLPRPRAAGRRGDRHRHRDRRPPRRGGATGATVGRRGLAAGSAVRHRGLPQGRHHAGDHDVSRRGVPPRQPQAGGRVLRRHRDRPLAARLHRERDGVAAPGARARRPVRRRGRPRRPSAPDAARARGVVPRRSAADAASGALDRAVRAGARPGVDRGGGRVATPARDRERGADPRRAVEAAAGRRPHHRPVVPGRDRPLRRVPARAQPDAARAGSHPHAQGRARAHHRRGAQHQAGADRAPGRVVPRRGQARRRGRSPAAA